MAYVETLFILGLVVRSRWTIHGGHDASFYSGHLRIFIISVEHLNWSFSDFLVHILVDSIDFNVIIETSEFSLCVYSSGSSVFACVID